MRLSYKLILINSLLSSVTLAAPSNSELEIMTVTENKYQPSFNQQAQSKNNLIGEELIERGVTHIEDISLRTPNFYLSSEGGVPNGQRFSMRGLTNTALFSEPAVVFYVDDIPYSSSSALMGHLFNIDTLDVYRSMQPGRFGKNAYAGAVDIKTMQPSNQLAGDLSLQLANYDQRIVTANGSGAIIKDQLYFSLNGQFLQRDGFLYNSYLNNHPDKQETFSGRALLKWTPNKKWDIRLTLTKEDFNYGASRFIRLDSPRFYTVQSEINEQYKQHGDTEALRIAYNSDNYELLSISSRRFSQLKPRILDLDLLPSTFTRFQDGTEQTWSQEFRLTPKTITDWDWQAGLFYTHIQRYGKSNILLPNWSYLNIELKDRNINNYAAFGHIAYQGFKDIKPHLDLRMDYVEEIADSVISFPFGLVIPEKDRRYSFFVSPKFGIDYILSSNILIYASTGLAAKPAGYTTANFNRQLFSYKKETAWQNEIGIKTNWLNDKFNFNLVGFYYDIDNYQLEKYLSLLDYSIVNADKAHSYGFEAESQLELIDNLWLEGALGYTYTQLDNYFDTINQINYAGKIAPFIPDFTGNLALQYKHPDGYFARAEWLATGRTYFDEFNTDLMRQKAYSVANIRIGYEKDKYSFYVFANNITDSQYYTFKTSNIRGSVGEPRMIGVRLGINF